MDSWSESHTPKLDSKVLWALEASGPPGSVTSLALDDLRLRSHSTPLRSLGDTSLRPLDQSIVFYNYADQTDYKETEEDLVEWLKEYRTRGVIR